MAVEREVPGLHSIAEKLRGHWGVAAGSGQRTRVEGRECKWEEVRLSKRYWQVAGSCEVELRRESDRLCDYLQVK